MLDPTPIRADQAFTADLIAALPRLRRQLLNLCRDPVMADDLVQEAACRALALHTRFERGTNLGAWLWMIGRNEYFTTRRNRRREVPDPDHRVASERECDGGQEPAFDLKRLLERIAVLPTHYRDALMMFGTEDLSYAEAAAIDGVAVGTMKSRIARARMLLNGGRAL